MTWQPIETAPKDGTEVLVWAQWDWDAVGDCEDEPFSWRVASWRDRFRSPYTHGFWSETSNPYSDIARSPKAWMPLPQPPEVTE